MGQKLSSRELGGGGGGGIRIMWPSGHVRGRYRKAKSKFLSRVQSTMGGSNDVHYSIDPLPHQSAPELLTL